MFNFKRGDIVLTQGDIGFKPVSPLLLWFYRRKVERVDGLIIVAEGEREGHVHTIKAPDEAVRAFQHHKGAMLLDVHGGVQIDHQQHDSLTLPPGVYKTVQQTETNPFGNHDQSVID